MKQKAVNFVFIALLLMVIAGCNLLILKPASSQASQLVTSVLSDPKTFNWALSQEFPNVFLLTYRGLTSENSQTGNIEPALAESWQVSPDKKRIIFTLRQGLKWSDGVPLTADDVVFTYNDIIFNPDIPTDARDSLKIGKKGLFPVVKKLDSRRIEFTFPEPFAPFLRTTTGPASDGVAILPKHALEESVKSKNQQGKLAFLSMWGVDTPGAQIVVNGPYQIESYLTSQRVVFRRNKYYWKPANKPNQLERIVWQITNNMDTQLLQFRSQDLDTTDGWGRMRPEDFSLLKREEKRGNFQVYTAGARPGTTFISFNLNQGKRGNKPLVEPSKSRWFNTLEFRQAVAYAINRTAMINNSLRGLGELQNSPISVQSPYYISPEEGLKVYDYNITKAKEFLEKAGFKYNKNGELMDNTGQKIRFSLITNAENQTRVSMGSQIKQNLSKIGIQVDFNPMAFNSLVDKLTNTLDWECYLLGFTGGIEPQSGANVWLTDGGLHSFNQQPSGQTIEGRIIAPWEQKIADLYIQAAQEFDEKKRKSLYAETQHITQEYLPMIYLVNAYSMTAIRNHIKGIKYTSLGGAFWNLDELEITDKANSKS